MKKWNLVIYMPAYNVAEAIKEFLDRLEDEEVNLRKLGIELKALIIVNDGSTDNTFEEISRYSKKLDYLVVLNKEKNEGAAKAVSDAMFKALKIINNGEYDPLNTILLRMDSDMEQSPEDIKRVLEPILTNKTEFSVGYIDFDSRTGLLYEIFNKITGPRESRRFLNVNIPQFCSGFVAFRMDFFNKVYSRVNGIITKFEKECGKDILTKEFFILAVGVKFGGKVGVIKQARIDDKWIKKQPVEKVLKYLDYHRKTFNFLERELR